MIVVSWVYVTRQISTIYLIYTGKPVSWMMIAPSITPRKMNGGSNNPAMRLYKFDTDTGQVSVHFSQKSDYDLFLAYRKLRLSTNLENVQFTWKNMKKKNILRKLRKQYFFRQIDIFLQAHQNFPVCHKNIGKDMRLKNVFRRRKRKKKEMELFCCKLLAQFLLSMYNKNCILI